MSITYEILDKDFKVVKKYTKVACFSSIVNTPFLQEEKYIRYYIYTNNSKQEVETYLKYIKNITIFKRLINIKEVLSKQYFTIDIEKFNGLQIFTALTLVRHLEEDKDLVKYITKINTTKLSSKVTKLDLLLIASMNLSNNLHHSITLKTSDYKSRNWNAWISNKSAKNTGLIPEIHKTFTPCGSVFFNSKETNKHILTKYIQ